MRFVDKPWGYEQVLEEDNGQYCMKVLHVERCQRLSKQYHNEKCETMYCIAGNGVLELERDGEKTELSLWPGRYYTITPGTIHRLRATTHSAVTVLEASTTELDDVVRLEDDYARED